MTEGVPLNEASINYFVCISAFAFGIAGLVGIFEIFKKTERLPQEQRYLRSIFIISFILIFSSMLPLMLDGCPYSFHVSSIFTVLSSLCIYVYMLYEIFNNKVRVYHKKMTVFMFITTAIAMIIILINPFYTASISIYKIAIFWGLFVLAYRSYNFFRHVVMLSE